MVSFYIQRHGEDVQWSSASSWKSKGTGRIVEKACAGDSKNDGENFWEALTKDVLTNLVNGLTGSLTKGLNNALVGRERNSTVSAPTPDGAKVCVTDAGACPLSGVPVGFPCYCQAANGATFMGFSK